MRSFAIVRNRIADAASDAAADRMVFGEGRFSCEHHILLLFSLSLSLLKVKNKFSDDIEMRLITMMRWFL